MITVKQLRDELAKYPNEAKCYVYEGEFHGVVVVSGTITGWSREQLGIIEASPADAEMDAVRERDIRGK